ncbi:MAG: hypothetical protein SGJ19_12835 [Planctomycetia bacterium]|nr:hypothetical protein [Planctomycetia bacterium]
MQQLRSGDVVEVSASKERGLSASATIVGCVILLVGIVAGLALVGSIRLPFSKAATVNFTLPADFDGPFVIVARVNQGVTMPGKAEYSFHIPSNGVLIVNDDSALRQWHSTVVSTADRALVHVTPAVASDRVGPNRVFLSKGASYPGAGSDSGKWREHWFYFGVPGNDSDPQKTQRLRDALEGILAK